MPVTEQKCLYRWLVSTFDLQLSGYTSILTVGHMQATLSKLLTYCVLMSTQPPTLSATSSSYRAMW